MGVAADGTVVVTYYDFRNDKPKAMTDAADFWAITCNTVRSKDNCLSNADWTTERRLTDRSFDFDLAPLTSSGRFVGDYTSIKSVGQKMYTIFGQAVSQDRTDIFLRTLDIPTVK